VIEADELEAEDGEEKPMINLTAFLNDFGN
jgi:hypothetical protein